MAKNALAAREHLWTLKRLRIFCGAGPGVVDLTAFANHIFHANVEFLSVKSASDEERGLFATVLSPVTTIRIVGHFPLGQAERGAVGCSGTS
jgi:hypothetical protein